MELHGQYVFDAMGGMRWTYVYIVTDENIKKAISNPLVHTLIEISAASGVKTGVA